ncbi:MAG: nicotinate-nucleotide adenylyltransferase [Candidatus Methylomirabilis oxyfera]|nr:nicotinate-nucleotide adenylyltransferase [Candidatus Methylomirabilis oxyfera]
MRIGVMGGTFDPIHLGHLRAAEEIYWAFELDRIIFVPAARPPHKDHEIEASPLQRYEMASLAAISVPYFSVSPIELNRPGCSYSVETVREFRKLYGEESAIYFIMGVDAFQEIDTWKDAKELLSLAQIIVAARPGWRLDEVERSMTPAQRQLLGEPRCKYLKISEITSQIARRRYEPRLVLLVEMVSLDISSSEIRQLVKEGRSIRYLVTDTVATYVAKHRLYHPACKQADSQR